MSDDHVLASHGAYERYAEAYAYRCSDRSAVRALIERFVALLPGAARVLDVGCGPGVDTGSLSLRGVRTVGLDIAASMLVMAAPHAGGHAVQADLRSMPFANAAFDGVWAHASVHHVLKVEMRGVAAEIARVLRPGGIVGLTVALGLHDGYASPDDGVRCKRWYSYFEPDELRAILRRAEIDVVDAMFGDSNVSVFARRR